MCSVVATAAFIVAAIALGGYCLLIIGLALLMAAIGVYGA